MKFKDWQFIDDNTKKPAQKPVQSTPPKEEVQHKEQAASSMTLKELLQRGTSEGSLSSSEVNVVASECGVDSETLYTLLEERGIAVKPSTNESISKVSLKELLQKGEVEGEVDESEVVALAEDCGIDIETMNTLMEERGITVRRSSAVELNARSIPSISQPVPKSQPKPAPKVPPKSNPIPHSNPTSNPQTQNTPTKSNSGNSANHNNVADYVKDTKRNTLDLYFKAAPSNDMIVLLRKNGWLLFNYKGCWHNRLTPENEEFVKSICEGVLLPCQPSNGTDHRAQGNEPTELHSHSTQNFPNVQTASKIPSAQHIHYPTSKQRLPDDIFERDREAEQRVGIDDIKLYGYYDGNESIHIVGEIVCQKKPKSSFSFVCTVYDTDGDIINTRDNEEYGGTGVVSSCIKPKAFFNGFPFTFDMYGCKPQKVRLIRIVPDA